MIKKILKIQLIIIILLLIFSIVFVFVNYSNFTLPIYNANKINNMILGDAENQIFFSIENREINIIDKKQSEKKYNLIISQVKNIFLGLIKDEEKNYLFNNQGSFNSSFDFKKQITDDTYLQMVYNKEKEQIDFIISSYGFSIGEQKIKTSDFVLYSAERIDSNSILEIGEEIIDLNGYNNETYFPINKLENLEIEKYITDNTNLFNDLNPSFEDGLWKKDVWDCQTDKEGSDIFMDLSEEGSDGSKSLKLSSNPGTACTNKTFPAKIDSDKLYKLSFDYKNIKGNKIQYYYRLSSEENSYSISETIKAENNEWNNFETIIKPKYDFDKIQIYFYAPSDGTEEIVNLYDNVKLKEYKFERELEIQKDIDFEDNIGLYKNIQLNESENKFEFSVNKDNLLKNDEASFENGLWKEEVGNCCDTKEGDPDILMDLDNDAVDGSKSLRLSSKNHCACSSKTFSVDMKGDRTYKLSFDYKNLAGNNVQYYYNLRNTDNENETKSEIIDVENNDWNSFETIIDSDLNNIKFIDIYFYASSDGKKEVINLYDNVRLEEYLPKDMDSYYLYANQEVDDSPKLEAVEFKPINRWKNEVVLHGVNNSFLLVYPEKYSENWKVYPYYDKKLAKLDKSKLVISESYFVPENESNRQANKETIKGFIDDGLLSAVGDEFVSMNFDGSIRNDNLKNPSWFISFINKPIVEEIHFQVNNYSNAWWIDIDDLCKNQEICKKNSDGTYEISLIIENKMNKYLNSSFCLFILFIVVCLVLLSYDFSKRRKICQKK